MTSPNVEPARTGEIVEEEVQQEDAATSDNSEKSSALRTPSEVEDELIDNMIPILERGKEIGSGSQSRVHESLFKRWPVVIKIYNKSMKWDEKVFNIIGAPHVCSPVGIATVHDGKDSIASIMPRHLIDLRKLIDSKRRSSGQPFLYVTAVDLIVQLAIGMSNLHKRDIMHRDIRAANVLVTHITPNKKLYAIAIADFDGSEDIIGTGFWRAPEILEHLSDDQGSENIDFTFACDVYSFAVTCFEILTGKIPFKGKHLSEYSGVLSGERPNLPENLPQDMASLINSCWHQEPQKRPKHDEILQILREMIRQRAELKPVQVQFDLADPWSHPADPWSSADASTQPSAEELLESLKLELRVLDQQNEIQAVRIGNELIQIYEAYKSDLHSFWENVPMVLRLINKGNEFVNSLPDHGSNTVKTLAIFSGLMKPIFPEKGLGPTFLAIVRTYSVAVLEKVIGSISNWLQVYIYDSFWASSLACRLQFARTVTMRALRTCFRISNHQSSEVEELNSFLSNSH